MSSGSVLITGATGLVGTAVAHHLKICGEPVVAAVRDVPQGIPPGTDVRVVDLRDPRRVATAFAGVDRLFLQRPPQVEARSLCQVIDLALERGVRQIVFHSPKGLPFGRANPQHAIEAQLKRVRAPFTVLRTNILMQELSTVHRDDIRNRGELFAPVGRARAAFVDAEDIGRVAARIFTEPGHLGKRYTLSGAQSLTYAHVADIMTEVLGYAVHYGEPTVSEFVDRVRRLGMDAEEVDRQIECYRVIRSNALAIPSSIVRHLTGTPATTLKEFAQRSRETWARVQGRDELTT